MSLAYPLRLYLLERCGGCHDAYDARQPASYGLAALPDCQFALRPHGFDFAVPACPFYLPAAYGGT